MPFGIKNDVEKKRHVKSKILLICEGKCTESDYFKELAKRDNSVILVLCGFSSITKDNRLTNLINETCEKQNITIFSSDQKSYIFDLDVFQNHPTLANHIVNSANDEEIKMYYTFPSFEYWILLSFLNSAKVKDTAYMNINEIKNMLKEQYKLTFKNGKSIPTLKVPEIVNKRNKAATNSLNICNSLSFSLSSKPNLELFNEINNDKTNKSNLHELIELIDNFPS